VCGTGISQYGITHHKHIALSIYRPL
jgi:hypothetical protein